MSILERLTCETADLGEENVKKLLALFPECACEQGQVDFDKLRQVLSSEVIEGDVERYQFTWPGKRAAMAEANRKTNKTFRPDREASVNFDTTENLYIEGDNLEALKLLQSAYAGKVKMIYIDPPYNTGKDFVYRDRFSLTQKEIEDTAGAIDEEGNRYEKNDSSEARYHTNWCNMMYPRLKLARELLSEDGIVFISIDENEIANLKVMLDEIYGPSMFIGIFKWNKTSKAPTLSQKIRNKYEYVLCYAKKELKKLKGPTSYNTMAPLFNSGNKHSKIHFEAGMIECLFDDGVYAKGVYGKNDKYVELLNDLKVEHQKNANSVDIIGRFKWSQDTVDQRHREGVIFSFKTSTFTTMYYSLSLGEDKFIAPSDLINMEECNVARNDEGYVEVYKLFDDTHMFDYCKPTSLIKRLVGMIQEGDSTILDFFSGSATTAHAVMQLNAEDGGNRKFILVQLPEVTDEKSEAYKAGYKNICEIGKERIRRAGKKIQEEHPLTTQQLDVGFRVLKIDASSINDASKPVNEMSQEEMNFESERIKADRSSEDLLFQVLLQTQIPLSERIERETICGNEVFTVGGVMVACLDKQAKLTEAFFTALAERQPAMAFFRDDTFVDDSARTNLEQIFKQFSKDTKIKVL